MKLKLKLALALATTGISMLSPRFSAIPATETEIVSETVTEATTDNLYPSCGIVTSITSTELEWTDFNGNIWVIMGDPEDWCEGDRIAVIMDNNGTMETIYDDIVVKTKYCGWEY